MQNLQENSNNIYGNEINRELFRKTIHMMIAFIPFIASVNYYLSVYVLGYFILFYSFSEMMRKEGFKIALISDITNIASRKSDVGKFVLGPVTLFAGALLALFIFPQKIAFFAIFALAFGDGLSSLIGKGFGSIRLPFTGGKTLEGSLACFIIVFIISYKMSSHLAGSFYISLFVSFIEAIPSGDFDNILIPVAAGFGSGYLIF